MELTTLETLQIVFGTILYLIAGTASSAILGYTVIKTLKKLHIIK